MVQKTQLRTFGAHTGALYFRRTPGITYLRAWGAFCGVPYGSFEGRTPSIPPAEEVLGSGARRIRFPAPIEPRYEEEVLLLVLSSLVASGTVQ